jgi:integrase
MLMNAGVPLKAVSEQMGHSSVSITGDIYCHVDAENRRVMAERIEAAMLGRATDE